MLSQPTTILRKREKKAGFIKNSTLIFAAFSTAFYSRIFCSITHAPSILNFFHFATVPFAMAVAMSTTQTKDRHQITAVWSIVVALLIFLGVMLTSAIVNNAGIPNVILNFLILGEPFMFLVAIA
jgi:hypothetical protein